MNFFLTIVLDGLIQASWLFIVALGLTLVFGVLKILNIAHGSFYALGAYIAATAVTMVAARSLPPSVGFAAMLVSVALIPPPVALLLERGLLQLFASLAGALTAPKISMQPGLSSDVIILSFAIVVIGGLGSVEGAAVGAILVGLARAASVHLVPQAELFMIYLIMTAVLMFRPEGLFKRETARRI